MMLCGNEYLVTLAEASRDLMARSSAYLPALFVLASLTVFYFSCQCEMKEINSLGSEDTDRCSPTRNCFCFFGTEVCVGRRQRYRKCIKRCEKRKKGSSHICPGGSCWVTEHFKTVFEKLHLPPPLPCRRKARCLELLQCDLEDCEESSEGSEDTDLIDSDMLDLKQSRQDSLCDTVSSVSTTESLLDETKSDVSSSSLALSHTPLHPRSRSTLMDMVRMQQWKFINDHPSRSILLARKQAKYHDADGLYPLHWACSGGPPVSIVEALLESYLSAARKRDQEGSTPLHFATHYSASISVVEKLVLAYPEAVRIQDKYGRTPLYHAVDKCASIQVIQVLLKADPSVALIACLPKEWREIDQGYHQVVHYDGMLLRAISIRTPLFLAWAAVLGDAYARKNFQGKTWDKAMYLLIAAYYAKSTDRSVEYESTSLLRIPAELFLQAAIALDMYLPDAVVPIAIRNLKETMSTRSSAVAVKIVATDDTGGEYLAIAAKTVQYSQQRSNELIQMIIEAFPSAASHPTSTGQSSLAIAAAAGKLWNRDGMNLIFSAAPEAVRRRDPISGLLPFMLAASASSSGPACAPQTSKDTEDIMGTSLTSSLRLWLEKNDPYNLLTQNTFKDFRLRQQQHSVVSQECALQQDHETAKLETIFQLIQSDPTVLSHFGQSLLF